MFLNKIDETDYTDKLGRYQKRILSTILNTNTLKRLVEAEVIQTNNYATVDMISDLKTHIFSETKTSKNVDIYKRNLQKYFTNRMANLMNSDSAKGNDITAIVRGELNALKSQLNTAHKKRINKITKYHYKDLIEIINKTLEFK